MNRLFSPSPAAALPRIRLQRGLLFGILIISALLAFEMFNYSTTDYSLTDLLGNLRFLGLRWATILSIAFCGIDFAGIARLFTPETGPDEPAEVWYLFGAWILAATMNAMLTWWGVSIAIINHPPSQNSLINRQLVVNVVPVFVAVMVWLIRVLIIGTLSVAGDRLFSQASRRTRSVNNAQRQENTSRPAPVYRPAPMRVNPTRSSAPAGAPSQTNYRPTPSPATNQTSFRPSPRPTPPANAIRPEPTYHPVSMSSGAPRDEYLNNL